jgi:F0F1-type ATP synthase assembly protein I
MNDQRGSRRGRVLRSTGALAPGEDVAWSVLSTLLAGPLLYGLLGWGLDRLVGTERLFLAIGIVVGFGLSFTIVYLRHGREPAGPVEQGADADHADVDGPGHG